MLETAPVGVPEPTVCVFSDITFIPQSAMVGEFTPWKWAKTGNQGCVCVCEHV